MDFTDVIFIVVIVILLLVLYTVGISKSKAENFDTYYNHDIGAFDVYNQNKSDSWQAGFKPSNLEQANRYANYTWSERDPAGMTVYDKYYEDYTFEIGGANDQDKEYVEREINTKDEDNVYDSKFSIRDGGSLYYTYGPQQIRDMTDTSPAMAYDWHSDELSTIVQKNY